MCLAARNRQKIHKIPILASKVIEFSGNREPVYDFLLVINTNLGPIHTISEIQRLIGWKLQFFPPSLSFSALAGGDPFQVYEKALRILKLESSLESADGED